MRRRATFIINEQREDFQPSDVQIKGRQLLHPGLRGAREEKLTFGTNELPSEITNILKQVHELHIRWSSSAPYDAHEPFLSNISPGLHVHYVAQDRKHDEILCRALHEIFSAEERCKTAQSAFIKPAVVSKRYSSSGALQYYVNLPKLAQFVAFLQRKLCPPSDVMCLHQASLLNAADYVDIDFDGMSHTLVLTAYWSKPLANYYDPIGELIFEDQWPLDISSSGIDKVEVGILKTSKATDAHDLQLEGFLTVLGEDDKPKPVSFSFPSRHHLLSSSELSKQSYSITFDQPVGLHPNLQIKFNSAAALNPPTSAPEGSMCALHAYLTLPSTIFADQYAFPTTSADPLFEAAHHIHSLRSISGELDLEAPDYVIEQWGSTMLLELSTPSSTTSSPPSSKSGQLSEWQVTVPWHLRYLPPSQNESSSHSRISIPYPNIFWACTAEPETQFSGNPFDRIHLGYDSLFGPETMFYHLRPRPEPVVKHDLPTTKIGALMVSIDVPVLNTAQVGGDGTVEWGTLVVVLAGFAWVVVKLWPGLVDLIHLSRNNGGSGGGIGKITDQSKVLTKEKTKKKQ